MNYCLLHWWNTIHSWSPLLCCITGGSQDTQMGRQCSGSTASQLSCTHNQTSTLPLLYLLQLIYVSQELCTLHSNCYAISSRIGSLCTYFCWITLLAPLLVIKLWSMLLRVKYVVQKPNLVRNFCKQILQSDATHAARHLYIGFFNNLECMYIESPWPLITATAVQQTLPSMQWYAGIQVSLMGQLIELNDTEYIMLLWWYWE